MVLKKKNLLITGLPGVGKTTLIRNLSADLVGLNPRGFYTEELRDGGVRKGFELVSIEGEKMLLSHMDIISAYTVGKYKVDLIGFEKFLDTLEFFEPSIGLIIIDEIGKMECLSNMFKDLCLKILDSNKLVIATIALKGGGFMEDIRRRDDVNIFIMTRANRDYLFPKILDEVYSYVR